MPKFTVEFDGVDEVQRKLGTKAAKELKTSVGVDVMEGVNDMAEGSYDRAPVDTGALRSSILASVERVGAMEYIYGSNMPYAQRQEYEHKTNRGYFRFSIWAETPRIEGKIISTIKRRLDG